MRNAIVFWAMPIAVVAALSAAPRDPERSRIRTPRLNAVHAVGGQVFSLNERGDGTVDVSWVETEAPAFESYGLSPDGSQLVYMPLIDGIATGELWREDLLTHTRSLVTATPVVSAAVALSEPFTIAYSYAHGESFAAAVVDVETGVTTPVPGVHVAADRLAFAATGELFFFEVTDPLLASSPSTHRLVAFDVRSGALMRYPTVPLRQVYAIDDDGAVQSSVANEAAGAFEVQAGAFQLRGDALFGEAKLTIRDAEAQEAVDIGSGVVLDVLAKGVLVRRITPTSSYVEYVSSQGQKTLIGSNAEITFTLPLARATLTQNGGGYSGACGIMDHTAGSRVAYAYDFQGPSGSHVLAVAAGSVVSSVDNVTCNSLDTSNCPIYSNACASNGGWGNAVVYRLADGTYVKTAHHESYSYQDPTGGTLCQGMYYSRQGGTGKSIGNMDGCGSHVHIQRQGSTESSAVTSPMQFSELSGAGNCQRTYYSAATEVSACIGKTLRSLSISGPSSVNGGSSAFYDAIAKWSDDSTSTVKPNWSENSSYTTISSSGRLEAKSVTSNKSVTVKARYSVGGVSKTATKDVTIVNGKTLRSLSISGPSSVNGGSSASYDAIAKWSDDSTSTVKPDWSENSSYTTISSSGRLKARSVTSNKSVTVKARYSVGGVSKTATKKVTIVNGKTLSSLSISGPSSVNGGSSASYDAIAKWSDDSTSTVKADWSENSSYTTISSSGRLKARSVTSDKSVTVKVRYSVGGVSKTATKKVKIVSR